PVSDGSGHDREFLRQGFDALRKAGFSMREQTLADPEGKPLSFEILLNGSAGEQAAIVWQRALAKIGVEARIRSVDASQYQQRLNTYDFDSMLQIYPSSLSPGVEQVGRWGSASRDVNGTYNYAGVASPPVDALIGE